MPSSPAHPQPLVQIRSSSATVARVNLHQFTTLSPRPHPPPSRFGWTRSRRPQTSVCRATPSSCGAIKPCCCNGWTRSGCSDPACSLLGLHLLTYGSLLHQHHRLCLRHHHRHKLLRPPLQSQIPGLHPKKRSSLNNLNGVFIPVVKNLHVLR